MFPCGFSAYEYDNAFCVSENAFSVISDYGIIWD